MRGERAHRLIAGRATFVGAATIPGMLLVLGRYPGAIAGRGRVRGEIWRLATAELLKPLDEYEGYNFERRVTVATLASGRRLRAWVYRYCGSRARIAEHTAVIPDGDWRRHRWR